MKTIQASAVTNAVKEMFLQICVLLDNPTKSALQKAAEVESSPTTRFALDVMLKNAEIAAKTRSPLCQDTGMAVVFADIGQDVKIEGEYIGDAINRGVREAYAEGYFRKSVLDPLTRKNTLDNTPAVIHYNILPGNALTLSVMAKGFGSENMSRLFMLTPSEGIAGIKRAVVASVTQAGGNPCPPVVIGVGVGGTMEKAALMSKKALFRSLDEPNEEPLLQQLEHE
ncbi:MAG: fumarate hydratase, partial [Clostridia bacterium]|nr:fumarate hydratase [Clostridia bacterium]